MHFKHVCYLVYNSVNKYILFLTELMETTMDYLENLMVSLYIFNFYRWF